MKIFKYARYSVLGCLLLFSKLYAQQISGRVLNQEGSIPFAGISLLRWDDSVKVKTQVADTAGAFVLANVSPGNYILHISALGHHPFYSERIPMQLSNEVLHLGDLLMEEAAAILEEITITKRKDLLEQRLDRLVMNVEGSALAVGNTALELLSKTPGVAVTDDGKVSIKGRPGGLIMINGKQTYLSGDQLINLLRGLQASEITRIEVLSNPSAKEDAAATGGLIDIVLKKPVRKGFNGNLTVDGGTGRGARMGASLAVHHRSEKWLAFGSYNQYYSNLENREQETRLFGTEYLSEQSRTVRPKLRSNNFRMGVDYEWNKKNTLGFLVNGGFGKYPTVEPNTNALFSSSPKNLVRVAETHTVGKQWWEDMLYNLHYVYQINDKGHRISVDIDAVTHFDKMDQQLDTRYLGGNGAESGPIASRLGDIPSDNTIYVGKVDYQLPLSQQLRLEAGWKGSRVRMENDLRYDTLANGVFVIDEGTSNHFIYREQIQAGYLNVRQTYGNWQIQTGLRAEQTRTKGRQVTIDSTFTRHYIQLFPSVFVMHEWGRQKMQVGYSRRIQRPSFWDMNPFRVYDDPFSYYEGNPQLLPSMVNSFELGHSWKGVIHTVLNYSHATDVVNDLLWRDAGNITYSKPQNSGSFVNYGLSVTVSTKLTGWWTANHVANLYRNIYRFGAQDERSRYTFRLNSQHAMGLGKGWRSELSGFYDSGNLMGVTSYLSRYQINIGIQKEILSGKGTLKMSVNDLTRNSAYRYKRDYEGIQLFHYGNPDSRFVLFSFTYRLGQMVNNTQVTRETGSEELKGRLK